MQLKWTNSSTCDDTDNFNNIMNDEAEEYMVHDLTF